MDTAVLAGASTRQFGRILHDDRYSYDEAAIIAAEETNTDSSQ